MKNKTKTYVLLAAVIGIWGTIAYKIVNGLNPDVPEVVTKEFDLAFKPKQQKVQDTFSIQNVERDPFLGTFSSNKKKKTSKKVKVTLPDFSNPIPSIHYNGIVKKNNSSDQVFVIDINGRQYLLKNGQIADSVKLVRGNSKEIIIRYKNKSQTIKRQ